MRPLLLLSLIVAHSGAARILAFYPMVICSHHYIFRPIIEGLASRGHQVVYVTGCPYRTPLPEGVTQMDISKEIPPFHAELNLLEMTKNTVLQNQLDCLEFALRMAPLLVGNPTVQRLIHSDEQFDAVMMESYFLQDYESALVHKFGAVGIETITFGDFAWMNELSGLPDNPSFQVDFKAELTQSMDPWQRVHNCYVLFVSILSNYLYMPRMAAVMDRFFNYTGSESRPPYGQLIGNRSLILVNSHFAVGYPGPTPPHRKEIAGVHILDNKPLPEEIQTFMDDSKDGVVYFSLGSNINVSDPAIEMIREPFMRVFEGLRQSVLFKWEGKYTGELPGNVLLGKWFPQQDVLAHNNCVLFITHGGYLSLTEAVHFGVPVIGIPFFAEQPKNLMFAEEAGIGRMLRLTDITYETVFETVKEVLSNRRYKEEMTRRSKMLRHRQQSPSDEAVYWIEHAIKYPNALTPKGASLSFVRLHLIDIGLFVVVVLLFVGAALWKLLAAVARLLRCRPTKLKQS